MLAKDSQRIKDLSLLEVQSYDVGKLNRREDYAKKYPQQKSIEGERIPTLRDVIQLVKETDHNTHLFIELKISPLKPEETKSSEEISKVVAKIIKVIVWTPDSKSVMKKLIKTGVDGITTNRPDLLLSVLKR